MAPPPLVDDLVEEILLRFPPFDPASLVRAALVCKLWLRIVSGEGFRRRFREFHRRAPVLGLLCNFRHVYYGEEVAVVRFVPTTSFPLGRALHNRCRRAIDARHGRVLLRGAMVWKEDWDFLPNDEFAVWDPMTGKEWVLPAPPRYPFPDCWNAAVLCAAHPTGGCDHLDCHRRNFLVVVVGSHATGMFVHVYSSETGVWNDQAVPHMTNKYAYWLWPSVLAGDALYFLLRPRRSILKYNLGTLEVSVIDLPPISYEPVDVLMTTEYGRLGFAAVRKSRLYLWTREAGSGRDAGWTQSRVIELQKLLPVGATSRSVVGFADGAGIVFVGTKFGVFSIDLKSQRARNVYEGTDCNVLPFMSFCTPAVGATYRGQGPSVGASSA